MVAVRDVPETGGSRADLFGRRAHRKRSAARAGTRRCGAGVLTCAEEHEEEDAFPRRCGRAGHDLDGTEGLGRNCPALTLLVVVRQYNCWVQLVGVLSADLAATVSWIARKNTDGGERWGD